MMNDDLTMNKHEHKHHTNNAQSSSTQVPDEYVKVKFQPFHSTAAVSFWNELSTQKLNVLKLDDTALPIWATYSISKSPKLPPRITVTSDSFAFDVHPLFNQVQAKPPRTETPVETQEQHSTSKPSSSSDSSHRQPPNSPKEESLTLTDWPIPGTLLNCNTLEDFKKLDKKQLLQDTADKLRDTLRNDPRLLLDKTWEINRFLVISFADLKKHKYIYWFAFPALVPSTPICMTRAQLLANDVVSELCRGVHKIRVKLGAFRATYFIILRRNKSAGNDKEANVTGEDKLTSGERQGQEKEKEEERRLTVLPLSAWESDAEMSQEDRDSAWFGLIDPGSLEKHEFHPSWLLRNFAFLLNQRFNLETATVVCLRDFRGFPEPSEPKGSSENTIESVSSLTHKSTSETHAHVEETSEEQKQVQKQEIQANKLQVEQEQGHEVDQNVQNVHTETTLPLQRYGAILATSESELSNSWVAQFSFAPESKEGKSAYVANNRETEEQEEDAVAASAASASASASAAASSEDDNDDTFKTNVQAKKNDGKEQQQDGFEQQVGWEMNAQGKAGPRMVDLSEYLDPLKLAEEACNLNLKLMKWRALPELDTEMLENTSCLLLGSGTLGCAVARTLLGWGFRRLSFVDNGKVSYSNPVRQSLFKYQDCLEGGKPKAEAAAAAIREIHPGTQCEAHNLNIPMPGHFVTTQSQIEETKQAVEQLETLIANHDVIMLLMDTRESRWLPSVLGTKHDKIVLNAALGFDTYMVMRHGVLSKDVQSKDGTFVPPSSTTTYNSQSESESHSESDSQSESQSESEPQSQSHSESESPSEPQQFVSLPHWRRRLGCYFCNDVVAPQNSTRDRTLDQQCTVTRPGLAPIAGSLLVELLVCILHHPLRHHAPAPAPTRATTPAGASHPNDDSKHSNDSKFGLLPHQIRGALPNYETRLLVGEAFHQCTACSPLIQNLYEKDGMNFLLEVFNNPGFLEAATGIDELLSKMNDMDVDVDVGAWSEEEEEEEC